ncbi:MAG: hypothetical protein HZA20_06015 [Nitrospirae bacterium]|nr:hypothetical protein [Nitrospirota bacterium]
MDSGRFVWEEYPETEAMVASLIREACEKSEEINRVTHQISSRTFSRISDWIESFTLSGALMYEIERLGYRLWTTIYGQKIFIHPRGCFPALRVFPGPVQVVRGITLKIESLTVFRHLGGFYGELDGTPGSGYSRILLSDTGGTLLFAAEKNADMWMPEEMDSSGVQDIMEARELILKRRRAFDRGEDGWKYTERIINRVIGLVGRDRCASMFLDSERRIWEVCCPAAMALKSLHDKLGLGWGNHDHHVFRSSRKNFHHLIAIFELMGFGRRERFLRGADANEWGVQALEQPSIGAVALVELDASRDEMNDEILEGGLDELKTPGVVGKWVGERGESIFGGYMHRLALRYDYDELRRNLPSLGLDISEPYAGAPSVRQALMQCGSPRRNESPFLLECVERNLGCKGLSVA